MRTSATPIATAAVMIPLRQLQQMEEANVAATAMTVSTKKTADTTGPFERHGVELRLERRILSRQRHRPLVGNARNHRCLRKRLWRTNRPAIAAIVDTIR